jgi:two-component system sensor histidine kinase SenX3
MAMTTVKHRWAGADAAPFMFATFAMSAQSDYERSLGALTMVAHDLRSPLANRALLVDALTSAAQSGDVHSLQVSKERAHRLIEHVNRLLRSVLRRAAVAADPLRLEPILIDLGDVIDEAVELNRPMAERCSVTITRGGVDSISAFGDPDLLVEAVDNLVSNAIKHSDIGGQVQCELVEQGNRAVIRVIDQGCGLSESQIKRIFQPFARPRPDDGCAMAPGSVSGLRD